MTRKGKRRGDGEGSVFPVRGIWRAQLPYYGDAGVRRFLTKTFPTKAEADEWITDKKHRRFQGIDIAPEKRTVSVLLDEWLELHVKKLSPKTARSYNDFAKNHLKPGLGHIRVEKLTTLQIQRFLNSKAEEKTKDNTPRYSSKTVKHLRDVLRGALNVAVEWGLIRANPAMKAKPPKQERRRPRVLSNDEARVFVNAIKNHRWGVLFRLILSLGLRKGEALGLQNADLELPVIHIRRSLQAVGGKLLLGPPKTESAVRSLPLSPEMAAAMKLWLKQREEWKKKAGDTWIDTDFVFTTEIGTPIYPRNLNRALKGILEAAKIPHLRVHDLRHSAATFAIADRVPAPYVQKMLGHSDVRTTLQVYSDIVPKVLSEAASTLERILVTDKVTDKKAKRPKKVASST